MGLIKKNYIKQYKVFFILSWVLLYLVYPIWISRHLFFEEHGFINFSYPLARTLVILGFILYFSISAYLMDQVTKSFIINKPVIMSTDEWGRHIKDNLFFVVVCCLSVALHIHTFSFPFILGEEPFVRRALLLYDALDMRWHKLFDIPIQAFFWLSILIFIIVIRQKKIANYADALFSFIRTNYITKLLSIFFMFVLFAAYSNIFPYYSYYESLKVMRYPPLSQFLYLTMYSSFGTALIIPRIIQFLFYLLSAVYLYRTILLSDKKETALLGATIFLFSPIIFSFASQASLASGAIFFMILISFYFLRFLKDEDHRDLMLTAFFIGTGFMYRGEMLIMFVVCFTYLLLIRIKQRRRDSIVHFKILLLPLIMILPYMKMGTPNPLVVSHLTSFDGLSIIGSMLYSQVSPIIFFLFLSSFIFTLLRKRENVSIFYLLIFIAYYFLFTLMEYGEYNHRYLMALYPTIAIFIAHFFSSIAQRIRWNYAFHLSFLVLTIYLGILCLVPRSGTSLITYKYRDFETQYFPIEKATDWIKNEVKDEAKILALYMWPYEFYIERMYKDKQGISNIDFIFYEPGSDAKIIIFPLQNLKTYCLQENISHIMFPYGPNNSYPAAKPLIEKMELPKYLHENMGTFFSKVAAFSFEDNYIYIYACDLHEKR